MDRQRVNQGLNSVFEETRGPRPPDLILQDKLKARAYINPQIVNCEFIKRSFSKVSLPSGNKIHVNPNFRGNGFGSLQKASLHIPPVQLNLNYQHEIFNVQGSTNAEHKADENGFGVSSVITSPSRFKKINNSGNKSMYTWSKDCSSSNKVTQSFNCGESNSYILPQASYKYTAYKKTAEIISPVSKTSTSNKKSTPIFKSKTKIINKSKTKLVNNISLKIKQSPKQAKVHSPIKKQSKFVYSKYKKSPMVRVASLVRNKYKYIKGAGLSKQSRYKIDKRKKLPEASKKKLSLKRVQDIRNLFPKTFYYRVNTHYGGLVSKDFHSWRKDEKIGERKINHFPNRRVVKIGGILYKSTANKLTLASKRDEPTTSKTLITNKMKVKKKNHIVYVRGEKFILDKNGKTLKRQTVKNAEKKKTSTPKRIDIGGVTYIQKSRNVLVRTNVHQARHLVNKAKHKSIALLTSLHKRSSMPCMIFCKFGRCTRHGKGLCMYKHDPKNVAICKKFLKGNCDDENCLLSHEVIQEKMATCRYFLNGFCTRENCPYLHVKLNENAAICENFLRGFCQSGKNCTKRHLYQCPEFDKFGTCSQGTKCHYPHKPKDKTSQQSAPCDETNARKDETQPVQYYVKSLCPLSTEKPKNTKRSLLKPKDNQNKRKVKRNKRKSSQSVGSSDLGDTIECVPKRVKLDDLPCFIPLKSDS